MTSVAVLVAGYLVSILLGRLPMRSQWFKFVLCAIIAAIQVGVVLLQLYFKEVPSLEKP